MTLLKHPCNTSSPEAASPTDQSSKALVFVINTAFIRPLKVLLKSMALQGTLTDCPIILITDEDEVRRDAELSSYADEIYFAADSDTRQFERIDDSLQPERKKLGWIPAYTFMKWIIFRDWGVDRLLFIDADIVCMGGLEPLLSVETSALAAAPGFFNVEVEGDQAATDRGIREYAFATPRSKRINSGVMVLGREVLSDEFRSELIRYTESGTFHNEQGAIRRYLAEAGMELSLLSPLYNFKSAAIGKLSPQYRHEVLSEIKLLHYAGLKKRPWEVSRPRNLADAVWHDYESWNQ